MSLALITDLNFPTTNPKGQPVESPAWGPGDGAFAFESGSNGKFGRVIHIANLSDEGAFMFDGMLRAEPGGGLFLPIDTEGRIGVQQRLRNQTTKSSAQWKADYAAGVIDIAALGRPSWELPRGYGRLDESASETATREAEEETKSKVTRQEFLAWTCDNTALSPHMTFNSWGTVDLSVTPDRDDDPFEPMLTGVEFKTFPELAAMIGDGTLYCDYTLGAIGARLIKALAGAPSELQAQVAALIAS
ncbi:MAG: NUDIX domain-containing protein [Patescibacteria group bacterium]